MTVERPPRGEAEGDTRGSGEGAGGDPGDLALSLYRQTHRWVSSTAFTRVGLALPRTLRFVQENLDRRLSGTPGGPPSPHLSMALAGHVAMDEAILALAMGPNRFPRRADYLRVGGELRACRDLFRDQGFLQDPASYHREPPPLVRPAITKAWTVGAGASPIIHHERLLFASEFEPRPGEVGRARWLGYEPNGTAGAWLLRHPGAPRPWLMCIHGFGMGHAFMDFGAFEAKTLHERYGFNVILPVLPLHGHRKVTRMSGEAFLSFDLMNSVHGLTQAIWDIRRILGWVREQGGGPVGVYGVSLGAYVAALLATLDGDLACVIAGIPVCDFLSLFRSHSPAHIRMRAIDHEILGGPAEEVHRVVSPLARPALVPKERRFIFGGLGDRVVSPGQAHDLWEHWQQPDVCWYRGSHVGYLWSDDVRSFVAGALEKSFGVEPAAAT